MISITVLLQVALNKHVDDYLSRHLISFAWNVKVNGFRISNVFTQLENFNNDFKSLINNVYSIIKHVPL